MWLLTRQTGRTILLIVLALGYILAIPYLPILSTFGNPRTAQISATVALLVVLLFQRYPKWELWQKAGLGLAISLLGAVLGVLLLG